ncbi:MAG: IPT/TIG domain-containing protein [Myxococcota bacterium]
MRFRSHFALACAALIACGDGSQATVAVELPDNRRLGQLPPESLEQLRLTLEIEGLLAESTLELDLQAGVARGSFIVPDRDATVAALARLYGARDALSEEVLLGFTIGELVVESGKANTIQFPPLTTSEDPRLDLNRNGRSNLEDLLEGLDPNLAPNPIRIAPETLNLGSETAVGNFTRSFVVISNDSNETADVNLETRLAPGVTLTVLEDLFALGPVPSAPTLSFTLDANDQQVVAVTFAPSNTRFLVGALSTRAELSVSNTRYASALSLLANPDGLVSRPPSDYELPPLPEVLSGYAGPLEAYPVLPLWSGAPVLAGIDEAAVGTIGGQDIDRAYWVFVPRGHRFSMTLDELPADADLYAWRVAESMEPVPTGSSTSVGSSAESLEVTASDEDVLLVIGIDRVEFTTAATLDGEPPDIESLSATLQATLLSVPEFLPSCDIEDEACVPPVETSTACPESYGTSRACAPERGGGEVLLRGRNFRTGGAVRLEGLNAICSDVTRGERFDEVRCIIPPARLDPRVNPRATIVFENPNGESAVLAEGFAYIPPAPSPLATSLGSGPDNGGSVVTVSVDNLFQQGGDEPTVRFGEARATILDLNASTLTVISPECIGCGVVNVTVTNPDGQSGTLIGSFEFLAPTAISAPSISGVSPSIGRTDGGQTVTIAGTGFAPGIDVRFGSRPAIVLAADLERVTVLTPAADAGSIDVRVTNRDGGAAATLGAFTYEVPAPTSSRALSSVNPLRIPRLS